MRIQFKIQFNSIYTHAHSGVWDKLDWIGCVLQVLPTVTGQPMRTNDGTQYVPMFPPFNASDPANFDV